MQVEAQEKRFGLLHELLPTTTRFAMLVHPSNPMTDALVTTTRAAAASIGRQVEFLLPEQVATSTWPLRA